MNIRHLFIALCVTALLAIESNGQTSQHSSGETAATNWPGFRGPGARGVSTSTRLPDRCSDTINVRWKREVAGRGWSSPIVWGERVFLTTVVNTGESEEPRKGLYFGGDRFKPPTAEHQWKVICLESGTGRPLWEKLVHKGRPAHSLHIKNSYASETPVTDGKRLYASFGNVGLWCLDVDDGRVVWSKRFQPRKMRNGWGPAASPVLHRGRLYLVNDNDEDSYLEALDALTGKPIWRVARKEKSNWATPFVWENKLRTEIITPGTGKNRAYDTNGKLLYQFGGSSSITIAAPYAAGRLLYVTSGYILDRNRPIFAIRPGGKGDISLGKEETGNSAVAWCQKKGAPYNPSTIVHDGLLYVLYDMGLVACYDAGTGKPVFGRRRLPNGRSFTSSPWATGGKIFCLNEYGETYVLKAGREFKLLHRNRLAEDDMCMATPALVGDRLILRTAARVYCLQRETK